MKERRHCVYSFIANAYVERFTFCDTGIAIEYTKEECRAARVESEDDAYRLALIVPHGSAMVHSGAKPSMESELARIGK